MKRWIWVALALVALTTAGITIVAVPKAPEWTTASQLALAEYEAGDAARRKVYWEEAADHYRRALELDPDFVVAKWRVTQLLPAEEKHEKERLSQELMTVDLSDLTPRERFYIETWRAVQNDRASEIDRLLDEYLEKNPGDPNVLARKAGQEWRKGDLEEAERLYQDVVEIDPNWVGAYNALGYIMKIRGRFTESEEYFKKYRFVAPDQANPHDSLGELYITTGRYEEAETSLENAIAIKPEFWASYRNLTILKAYLGDYEAIYPIIERARVAGAPDDILFWMDCRAKYAEMAEYEEWHEILEQRDSSCVAGFNTGLSAILTHRAACHLGDWKTARWLEEEALKLLADLEKSGDEDRAMALRPVIPHLKGIRLALRGNYVAAATHLQAADDLLGFIGADLGMYKLYNRMLLAETLLAGGETAKAHHVLAQVRSVNSRMLEQFEETGFRSLGLDRS
jgi:tetratricopeptide (TPR) repeat protein